MNEHETTQAAGCPVLSYSPHERRPIGEWAAFFDQLRADAPVVRNTFANGYYVLTRYEDILGAYQDPETFSTDAVTVFEPERELEWRHEAERLDGRPAPRFSAETVVSIKLSPDGEGATVVTLASRQTPADEEKAAMMRDNADYLGQMLESSLARLETVLRAE